MGAGRSCHWLQQGVLTASLLQTISCCCSVNAKQTFLSRLSTAKVRRLHCRPGLCPTAEGPSRYRRSAWHRVLEEPHPAQPCRKGRGGWEWDRVLSAQPGRHRAPLTPCPPDAPHALSPGALSAAMESRKQDMELLSNSMAAYAHIRANPESFGLYFVLGVCFGLVLTLCLLLLRISCRPRTQRTARPGPADLSEDDDDDEDEEEDTVDRAASESLLPMTEIPLERHSPGDGAAPINVFASAEELERAQRLEERERIIREIWRNGQPDLLGAGTLGRGHYY
ncbi:protein eva-1 homolog B isoform X2 [Tympanuchus pallidicinctus]|uniref:protein eva-1 homolog B isoform X2 n=1 Tax=Tympanuchus pallidicinctus TaxID=109042 RepID=UPI0022877078|nr:protein eva-1 homolog B isoform X2 [Tympanuchus pallidicinctus]